MRASSAFRWTVALALIGSVLFTPPGLAAQQGDFAALRVRVIDASTKTPINGARVGFSDLKLFVLTDKTGIAQMLKVPPGDRLLEVTMLGYGTASATMTFESHAIATGDIALKTEPVGIDGITVTGTAELARLNGQGFYQRRKLGIGHFLGPMEIASTVAIQPSGLFKGISSVRLIPTAHGRFDVFSSRPCSFMSANAPGGGAPPAAFPGTAPKGAGSDPNPNKGARGAGDGADIDGTRMRLYLDGAPYYEEIDRLPLEMIQAAEVYVGAETPIQYTLTGGGGKGDATCGVILLWTK